MLCYVSGSCKFREQVDSPGVEQKGKGDVEIQRHVKDSLCHPTCDGDQPALVNVIVDEHDMRKRCVLAGSALAVL